MDISEQLLVLWVNQNEKSNLKNLIKAEMIYFWRFYKDFLYHNFWVNL